MIHDANTIESLLKDRRRDWVGWDWFLGIGVMSDYFSLFTDNTSDLFGENLTASSFWDDETEYYCSGCYYRGTLFLVADCFSDGEDRWDEDWKIVDKAIACEVLKMIMQSVTESCIATLTNLPD